MIAMPKASGPKRTAARAAKASGSNTCRVGAENFASAAADNGFARLNAASNTARFSVSSSFG